MSQAIALTDTERRIAERIDPSAMEGLTVSASAGGVVFVNADQLMHFAKTMAVANSGVRKHLRGNVGACLAICQQAVEWGMSPYAVANKSYFVNDQIAFESQLVQAVILKRAPIKGRIKFEFTGEGEKRVCRAWARLADDPDEIAEYISPEFGKITPKNSPLWKADPDQQHAYYSGRALCRRHFPDVLLGVYAVDELQDGETRSAPAPAPSTQRKLLTGLDRIAAGPTIEHQAHGRADDFTESANADAATGAPTTTEQQNGAPAAGDQDEGEEDTSPRGQLLERLRSAAMEGPKRLKLKIGKLTGEEQALVTPEDIASLEAAAQAVAGREG